MLDYKLHILFLCGWFPSRVSPNNGDFIERHAEAVATKHQVTVLHIITDSLLKEEIEIISDKKNSVISHIAYLKETKNPLKKMLLYRKAFFLLLKKIDDFDGVHLNEIYPFGLFSLYLKWFQKKPFIISEHWTGYHKPQSKKLSFTKIYLSKIITKNASFICPVSNDLSNSLQTLGFKGNYKRIPNVVNTNIFYPIKNKDECFTIIHVSNMVNKHKNITGILNTIKKVEEQIPNFKLKLIGENSLKYKKIAENLNLSLDKIKFIDHISYATVAKEMQQSNLFVLFSNFENLPCVILESFSCGLPVISTNVGGIKEYFPKKYGYLINVNDQDALLEKIIAIYNDFRIDKKEMYNYVLENFSKDKIAIDFGNLYYKMLKS